MFVIGKTIFFSDFVPLIQAWAYLKLQTST